MKCYFELLKLVYEKSIYLVRGSIRTVNQCYISFSQSSCIDTIKRVDATSTGDPLVDFQWLGGNGYEMNGRKEVAFQRVPVGATGEIIGVTFDAQYSGTGTADLDITFWIWLRGDGMWILENQLVILLL